MLTQGSCPAAVCTSGSGSYSLLAAGSKPLAAFPDTWVTRTRRSDECSISSRRTRCRVRQLTNFSTPSTPPTRLAITRRSRRRLFTAARARFQRLLGLREADGNLSGRTILAGGGGERFRQCGNLFGASIANMPMPVDALSPTMHNGLLTSTNRIPRSMRAWCSMSSRTASP